MTKEELGGSSIHARGSGAVDNEVESEDEAFAQIRRFLSYLPSNVWRLPPRIEPGDDPRRREEELISIIPRDRRRAYDVRRILNLVLDRDSFFEIGEFYGRPLVTGLARLNGYPVGVLAGDPMRGGGALDAAGSEKMTRFVDLCDTFHLPVVNFVDQPGFPDRHAGRTRGHGPIRRAGDGRRLSGDRALGFDHPAKGVWRGRRGSRRAQSLNLRYAWPSGDWGSLPIEGGVQAAYKRDIESSPDPDARRREIEETLNELRSPFRTAEAFGVEEIIDPRDTRPLLCDWVELAYELIAVWSWDRSVAG